MADYAPGMRVIVRGEEWLVKKVETNSMGNKSLHCVGISTLIKDKEAIFLDDLEKPEIVDPAKINFVVDESSHFIITSAIKYRTN